jgi:hypothetical protein
MCTVTIVPRDGGFRLVCNRDERLDRAAAERPCVRRLGSLTMRWPTDPTSGGTWIGMNDRGLAAAVLNRHSGTVITKKVAPRSRGTIIPPLLSGGDLPSVITEARLIPEHYDPFTLVVIQGHLIAVITSTGSRIARSIAELTRPVMFTSSSLGDELVDGPRRALFECLVARGVTPLAAQSHYHDHRWSDRPAISVLMSRPGAATVSQTVIDVVAGTVSMRYRPITPERAHDGRTKDGE